MKPGFLFTASLSFFMWACGFDFPGLSGGEGAEIDSSAVHPESNRGAEQKIHWTGMSTRAITEHNGTWPDFSHLRQYEKDSLLIHEFYYSPHQSNGVDYGTLYEDSNWYDDQARLIFSKQFYNPPTFLRRSMAVHHVYRTGNAIDSMIDTLFETAEKGRVINVFKTRISSSPDGRSDSIFVKSRSFPEFMTRLYAYDTANRVSTRMSVAFHASGSQTAQDTEYVTTRYMESALVNKVYQVIRNRRLSKDDSIAYTYRKNGKLDSVFVFKSGSPYSRGKVDYRIILDMEKEIQAIYNWPTVHKKAAEPEVSLDFFIPPCHQSR